MSFLYSNDVKNDVAAVIITKKEEEKIFGTFFPFLDPWDWNSDKYRAPHKSWPGWDINFSTCKLLLDIWDTYTVAKWIQWCTLLLSYYKMNILA